MAGLSQRLPQLLDHGTLVFQSVDDGRLRDRPLNYAGQEPDVDSAEAIQTRAQCIAEVVILRDQRSGEVKVEVPADCCVDEVVAVRLSAGRKVLAPALDKVGSARERGRKHPLPKPGLARSPCASLLDVLVDILVHGEERGLVVIEVPLGLAEAGKERSNVLPMSLLLAEVEHLPDSRIKASELGEASIRAATLE